MPHVSVIIPVFNSAHLIGHALQSVFAQTYSDFEVVVVDDGSSDQAELVAVLQQWSDRVHYVRQANGGPAAARNTGIAHAKGELIAFLDADDEWLPEKLARQVDYFAEYPETGLLHTAVVDESRPQAVSGGPPRAAFCDLFHTVFFVNTLTVMIPRRVLQEVGNFDERREVHIEDWDLWLRIAARHPFGYLAEPLAYHRPGGFMSSQVERTYAAQVLVMEKNFGLCQIACERHRAAPQRCERERRHVLHRDWGYDRLVAGNPSGAREQFGRALSWSPLEPRTAALLASTFLPDGLRSRLKSFAKTASGSNVPARASAPALRRRQHTSPALSLIHDTVYRRARRRALARLHDIDDAISRSPERKRVMFDAASPMSFAIFRPVYERLRQDPRLELWFTAHGRVWQPADIYQPAGVATNIVSPTRAAWMKVDLYVNADFWDMTWLHRRTRRIHLFHGVAGKYGLDAPVDLAPTISVFDSLLFVNADRRGRYIEAGLVPDDDLKAPLIGYPKVDALVNGTFDRADVLASLNLDPATSTIIYAPTWSPYSSLNSMGEEIVERLQAEGLQVVVKLHDRSYDRRERGSGGVDWAERLSRYESHARVRVVRQADSSPFLVAADAMVSDHSSIAFEYMLLDRPVVVIDRPELIRAAGVNRDKVMLLRSAADVVSDADGLVRGVLRALAQPQRLGPERRAAAASLFHHAGTATERAVSHVYRLIELPAHADNAAPVNARRALSTVG
jgi:glycosyltransferase involved in cell wall biosynthesis